MRWYVFFALAAMALSACGSERRPDPVAGTPTPTPRAGLTPETFMVNAADLPNDCRLDREGEFIIGQYSRSFVCPGEDRLTATVSFQSAAGQVEEGLNKRWSNRETAEAVIRAVLQPRPINQDSIQVTDITDRFPRVGEEVEQERVYCATFTDPSGTVKVAELYGSYRFRNSSVEYTAFSQTGAACNADARIVQAARTLARVQLQKLRDAAAATP